MKKKKKTCTVFLLKKKIIRSHCFIAVKYIARNIFKLLLVILLTVRIVLYLLLL